MILILDKGHITNKDAVNNYLKGKSGRYSLTKAESLRSLNQNNYLFGVVYKYISEETGEDIDRVHDLMRLKFHYEIVEDNGESAKVLKTTTKMSTIEFNNYIEQIVRWAASFLNLNIPMPNEADYEQMV